MDCMAGARTKKKFLRARCWRVLLPALLAALGTLACGSAVRAAGGPESLFLVVNERSWASRTLANHYAALRYLPPGNVYYLDWGGSVVRTDLATFREKILQPILATIKKRGLDDQIDQIIYSADFPYEIDFSQELPQPGRFTSGSLTGLTFLYQLVLQGQAALLGGQNNWYAHPRTDPAATRGFDHHQAWAAPQRPASGEQGRRYYLSTMLGYTSGRGNGVEEVISYLRRSALADGSHPDGTVYFMAHDDVRSKTRSGHFQDVVDAIRREGGRAEIVEGNMPLGKDDVVGAMLGRANLDWNKSRSQLLPGAICENLTSFGGVLKYGAGQTPLTHFLRFGPAASSGTVIEPYALLAKFPHPSLHLHYRRGCSLAEAFFLSVTAPYQLLIVGDPLCRPFGRIPKVAVEGLPEDAALSGTVQLTPSIELPPDTELNHWELYVDGRRRMTSQPGESFEFDSSSMPDGYHELRVVGVLSDRLATRGRWIRPIMAANHDRAVRVRLSDPSSPLPWHQPVRLHVAARSDAQQVVAFQNHRLLARAGGGSQTLLLPAGALGLGPVRVYVAAVGASAMDNAFASPLLFELQPGPLLPARPSSVGVQAQDGLLLTRADGTRQTVTSTGDRQWLQQAKLKTGEPFTLLAEFTAERTAVHQFQVEFHETASLFVDGVSLAQFSRLGKPGRRDIPVFLEKGEHLFRWQGIVPQPARLDLQFGESGTRPLSGPQFQHLP